MMRLREDRIGVKKRKDGGMERIWKRKRMK